MSRVVPEFNSPMPSNNTVRRIEVRPRPITLRSDNTSLNLIKEIRRKESDSPSKIRRFVESNSYIQYDTKWSRLLIFLTVVKIALAVAFLIFYVRNCNAVGVYVHKDAITEEFKQKNNQFNELNTFQTVDKYATLLLGGCTVVATGLQFIYMYKRNTFNTKDIDFTQI